MILILCTVMKKANMAERTGQHDHVEEKARFLDLEKRVVERKSRNKKRVLFKQESIIILLIERALKKMQKKQRGENILSPFNTKQGQIIQ